MIPTATKLSRLDIEHLPNFRRKTRSGEYSSSCPWCGGEDRFLFWPEKGNYFCRVCTAKGFVTEANSLNFTPEQYEAWQRAEERRKADERRQAQEAIDRLNQMDRAEQYHAQMTDRSYWYGQGLTDATIDAFRLGYSPACPTCPDSASYTIPIYYQGRLYNIRHRLATPNGSGKYRPEMPGLPAALFNTDALSKPDWMTILVEGEVKAMVLQQHGYSVVGVPGANSFKAKWVRFFEGCGVVYIALDPGASEQAWHIGELLRAVGVQVRVCTVPVKPDDFFVKYGGTSAEFFRFLMLGKRL